MKLFLINLIKRIYTKQKLFATITFWQFVRLMKLHNINEWVGYIIVVIKNDKKYKIQKE